MNDPMSYLLLDAAPPAIQSSHDLMHFRLEVVLVQSSQSAFPRRLQLRRWRCNCGRSSSRSLATSDLLWCRRGIRSDSARGRQARRIGIDLFLLLCSYIIGRGDSR